MKKIIELSEKHKKANHIPEDVWELSRDNEVFIRDEITGELIQVLDCTGKNLRTIAGDMRPYVVAKRHRHGQ